VPVVNDVNEVFDINFVIYNINSVYLIYDLFYLGNWYYHAKRCC